MPHGRKMRVHVLNKSDVVSVQTPAFDEEFDDYRLDCIVPLERHNGNTELWVDMQGGLWNFLSKLALHEYRQSLVEKDEAPAVIDSSNTDAAPIAAEPAPMAHSPKRQSPGDCPRVESASPSKRQTTLLSFLKPS